MAPSRRKGVNKASSAAARLKWKLGDLVLAKVKGFPAWPATVSEPEKWGYPADLKKVFVHFFGSQQIAFCSPGDVEEFTEQKKLSLLGRRHGKGSEFLRALNEMVDCFEKLKKQDTVTSDNLTEETITTNENNSDESLTKSSNDEAPVVTVKELPSIAMNDLDSLTEAAVAAAAEDETHMEAAHSDSGFTSTHVYSTRSKSDAAQSRNIGPQRRISARRLRSCLRRDSSRLKNRMLPSFINTRSSRRSGTNALQDKSLRRSKRIMKSSDDSEGHDVDSPAFISNKSIEDNDSEIMTVDSDRLSLNDGISVDSGCKRVGEEPFTVKNEVEAELSDRLDFQTNTTIVKKKRKPNRKRHRNDIIVVAKQDEVVSETKVVKTESVSLSFNGEVAERHAKEDGDEHLPLVKRARVRKGRPSPVGDDEGTSLHEEEKTSEVPESPAIQSSLPLNSMVDAPAGGEYATIKIDPANSSLLNASPSRKPQFWEIRKNFVDGEAALPPSKRLHRALEAMCANVAEDSQRASSCSPTVNTHSNECSSSSFVECSELSIEKTVAIELGSGQVDDHCNGDSQTSAYKLNVGLNMVVREKDVDTSTVVSDCETSCAIATSNPDSYKVSVEHVEGADGKRLKMSPLNEHPAETDAGHQYVITNSPNVGEELSDLDHHTPRPTITSNCCKDEPSDEKEATRSSDPDISQMNSASILVEQIADGSLNIDKSTPIDSADGGVREPHEMNHVCLSDNNHDIRRSESVEEVRPASLDLNVGTSTAQVKILNTDHHLEGKVVSDTRSSFLADGPDTVARESPPRTSKCNVSASDNNICVEKTSSCRNVQSHPGKGKLAGKTSSNVELLSSFEAIIRTLTRTKEIIGRATRIAIDCAKSGLASKVLEIITRSLESESSPRKRIDLFFLVDSITQCSGSMKGKAGIYPTAIQALLSRLLLAAAPPGSFNENHRQCLKVLRVWLGRKVLPEPMIRHHIREMEALYSSHITGGSRRSCKFERPFDDPIREMEGMSVDEYGSNSRIQLPGFCMPPMLRDDDGDSDSGGKSLEAVTPEHNLKKIDGETNRITAIEKRSHILEDVDGELEMEDVSPNCEAEFTSTSNNNTTATDCTQMSSHQSNDRYGTPFAPQQSKETQPRSAPIHPLPPSADPKLRPSSQEPRAKQSYLPRVKPRSMDVLHHRSRDSRDSVAQLPRHMPHCTSPRRFSDQPNSNLSGRACNNSFQPVDGSHSKTMGFHLRPPNPAPSDQFSYIHQPRRDIPPPPPHPDRFHTRNAENGNFYRDRDRNIKFSHRDSIGDSWRPPLPPISGPQYHDNSRMGHVPVSYSGPPRESVYNDNRWDYPPRSINHRQFNPYRPPSGAPIPVANRGLSFIYVLHKKES
ncbi:PREDICTED: HUA2-like protein 2, partial [Erythranthe guttata]|uniref:HUA2-like protein 2 n=1 Tax=Erythranthe guttata TaxID=4155 RepID=UPI00064E0CD0